MYQPYSIKSAIAQIEAIDTPNSKRTEAQIKRNAEYRIKLVKFLCRQANELQQLIFKFAHLSKENEQKWNEQLTKIKEITEPK